MASGADLGQVLVFAGQDHVRVLVTTEGDAPDSVDARSSPAVGEAPARATLVLGGLAPGDQDGRKIPVDAAGVRHIKVVALGDGTQITAALGAPMRVRARQIRGGSVILDLVGQGSEPDGTLPSEDQLAQWREGLSLVRQGVAPDRAAKLVVIDPGHGGFDHGAVGTTGTREADIALQISLRTQRLLDAHEGIETLMTRDTDVFIPLRERAAMANAEDAALFLSIHANAALGPDHWGIETYSLDTASDAGAARVARRENAVAAELAEDSGGDPLLAKLVTAGNNQLSRTLASQVQQAVVSKVAATYGADQVRDLGPRTALFYVLVSTRMPAILFESSFVSNPADERRLRTPHYQQTQAEALAKAVVDWLEQQD